MGRSSSFFVKKWPQGTVVRASPSHNVAQGLSIHFMGSLSFFEFIIIFVLQRAATPKKGEEFRQKSIGAFGCSLAMPYGDWGRRTMSMKLTGTGRWTGGRTGPRIESG